MLPKVQRILYTVLPLYNLPVHTGLELRPSLSPPLNYTPQKSLQEAFERVSSSFQLHVQAATGCAGGGVLLLLLLLWIGFVGGACKRALRGLRSNAAENSSFPMRGEKSCPVPTRRLCPRYAFQQGGCGTGCTTSPALDFEDPLPARV